jgi:hypothetical protein
MSRWNPPTTAGGPGPDWIEAQGLTLATCRQADLEPWMPSDDVRHRWEAGHFVRWALAQKIARDLSFPAVTCNGPLAALFQLAIELPATVPARALGIDITVAVKWQRAAAGDRGACAAEISRRNSS